MPSDVKPQGTETVGTPQMLNGLVSRDSSARAGSGLPSISTLDWPILGAPIGPHGANKMSKLSKAWAICELNTVLALCALM